MPTNNEQDEGRRFPRRYFIEAALATVGVVATSKGFRQASQISSRASAEAATILSNRSTDTTATGTDETVSVMQVARPEKSISILAGDLCQPGVLEYINEISPSNILFDTPTMAPDGTKTKALAEGIAECHGIDKAYATGIGGMVGGMVTVAAVELVVNG